MDGTQSSFIIDEDVLWMSQCCCGLKSAVCVSERCVCGSATFFVFFGGGGARDSRRKSVLVISAVAPVNSY